MLLYLVDPLQIENYRSVGVPIEVGKWHDLIQVDDLGKGARSFHCDGIYVDEEAGARVDRGILLLIPEGAIKYWTSDDHPRSHHSQAVEIVLSTDRFSGWIRVGQFPVYVMSTYAGPGGYGARIVDGILRVWTDFTNGYTDEELGIRDESVASAFTSDYEFPAEGVNVFRSVLEELQMRPIVPVIALTPLWNLVNDPECVDPDIEEIRSLRNDLTIAVAEAFEMPEIDFGFGFYKDQPD